MKKLFAAVLLLITVNAYSQNTTTLPSPTTSVVLSTRYYGTLTDSLRQFWFNTPGGGWNRFYSATEANLRFATLTGLGLKANLLGGNTFTGTQNIWDGSTYGLTLGYAGTYGSIHAKNIVSKTANNAALKVYGDGSTTLQGGSGVYVDVNGSTKIQIDATDTYLANKVKVLTAPTENNMPLRWQDKTFYNILTYGGVRDSTADNTAAINAAIAAMPAAGGTLYFPAGIYKLNSSITLTKPVTIVGDGMDGGVKDTYLPNKAATKIAFTITNGAVFNVNSPSFNISNLDITSVVSPIAGSTPFKFNGAGKILISHVSSSNFYDGARVEDGSFEYLINDYHIDEVHRYGLFLDNSTLPDYGDQSITNSVIRPYDSTAVAAFYIQGGGGARIIGNKINSGPGSASKRFDKGIYINNTSGVTSVLMVSANSFENINNQIIYQQAGSEYGKIVITGNEFLSQRNTNIIELNGTAFYGTIAGNSINSQTTLSGSNYAIKLGAGTGYYSIGVNSYGNIPTSNYIYDIGSNNQTTDLTTFSTDGSIKVANLHTNALVKTTGSIGELAAAGASDVTGALGYTPNAGAGASGYYSKYTGTNTQSNGAIFDTGSSIGVNTTTPVGAGYTFDLTSPNADVGYRLHSSNSGYTINDGFVLSLASTLDTYLYNYENADIIFGTNNAVRVKIKSDGKVNIEDLTASQLVATDVNKNLVSVTALPSGTTATTPSAGDNSTKVATTAYVDGKVLKGTYSTTASSTSTFTITIGVTQPNNTYNVFVTPTWPAASVFGVVNKTTTTFDIVSSAPLSGGVSFDWMIVQ